MGDTLRNQAKNHGDDSYDEREMFSGGFREYLHGCEMLQWWFIASSAQRILFEELLSKSSPLMVHEVPSVLPWQARHAEPQREDGQTCTRHFCSSKET